METYVKITGFDNYSVSDLGNVRNDVTGRVLKGSINEWGYKSVKIYDGHCGFKMYRVNRLVAEHFIPNPEGLKEVNHKDEDKTNNKVTNLEWCSSKSNSNHGTRNKRIAEAHLGSKHKMSLKHWKVVDGIRVWFA